MKVIINRFACGILEPINYIGYGTDRQEIIKNIQSLKKTHIFITAHHLFRIEHKFIKQLQTTAQLSFDVIIVDEAQAIKNSQCMLINCLRPYKGTAWFLLMTGTPIQNNLSELYSLLTLVDHNRFIDKVESEEAFNKKYSDIKNIKELKKILRTYMIRRTKDVVCKDIPACQQVRFPVLL
uniref:Helicase ATP-binding domain-containing protein n=1 Tax=Heterorhabditis bacteriophora TaxID=37862 RepID=A0A1I7WGF4_HETBA